MHATLNAAAINLIIEAVTALYEQGVTIITDHEVSEVLNLHAQGLTVNQAARLVRVDWQNLVQPDCPELI